MGFTTPCFIRKNTQELRKKLIELGYKSSRVIDDNEEQRCWLPMSRNSFYLQIPNFEKY